MSTQVTRLKELVKVAQALPVGPNKLRVQGMDVEWDQSTLAVYEDPDCGTTACLAGFAGLTPYFRKHGLKYDRDAGLLTDGRGAYLGIYGAGKYFGMTDREIDRTFYYVPQRKTKAQIKASLVATLKAMVKKYSAKKRP